jgi:recombination protein RecT
MKTTQPTNDDSSKALAPLKALLAKARPTIQASLPSGLTVDRQIRVTVLAVSTTPKLAQCSPVSILQACLHASQLGLEFGGPLGHAYPVPYWSAKRKCLEAQCLIGYRGLIALARRGGEITSVEMHAVHERDDFSFRWGLTPELSHTPCRVKEHGPLIAAYALVRFATGEAQFDVLWRAEIDAIRARMRPHRDDTLTPWDTDFDEMAKKTAFRRLSKVLPLKIETAIALGDALEKIDLRPEGDTIEVQVNEEGEVAPSLADKVRKQATDVLVESQSSQ